MDKRKNKNNSKYSKFPRNTVLKQRVQEIKPIKDSFEKHGSLSDSWNLYLPNHSFEEYDHFREKLTAIEIFLSQFDNKALNSFSKNQCFRVNVSNISKDKVFLSHWPEFMTDLINSPNQVIGLFGFSMDQLIKKQNEKEFDENITETSYENGVIPIKLNPRFTGLQNFLPFQDLKMHKYGKFVTIMGTVVRVSDVKPFCTCMAFKCKKCGTVQVIVQNEGCYTTPSSCTGSGCFCKAFKRVLSSPLTQTEPFKIIRLQELNTDHSEAGRVPRTIECELTHDLTNLCMPGDTVILSGTVTTSSNDEKKLIGKEAMSHVLRISANSVVYLKGENVDSVLGDSAEYCEIKTEDLRYIQKIHSEDNLFRLVVSSLSPNIYGHELVKAGLILGLFGGRDKAHNEAEKKQYSIRENSHILIVGDPGLGKSQMLLACANVSPRGVYVCGTSTTSAGLTVTISKDRGGDNSLEAGALVLADQGHCCIDEFDNMMHHHSALLEAMEQQTISMAKSGVVCTLPARTSILAAANPSGGHYNKAKTVSENLKIGGALLSRFDLVFIVQDEPDQELDDNMSKHAMGLHTRPNQSKSDQCSHFSPKDSLQGNNRLLKKLKLQPNEKLNFIPPAMLQKYISYARKFSQPKITPEVAKILQEFYLDMRKQHKLSYTTPITTRQLESLIRLTEARARVELRASCTRNDAEEVIEIMKYSMRETYSDEFGNIDFDRSIHGSGMSKSGQAKKLIQLMTKIATTKGDDCFTKAEIQQLGNKLKITPESLYVVIETLNEQGFMLKKGHELYQIQTL